MCKPTNVFVIDKFNKAIADEISRCGNIAIRKLEDNITKQTLNVD